MDMSEQQILARLGLALAIGLLVGVERGWRERTQAEGERTAGLRTFALIGLSGGIWGLLTNLLGPIPLAAAFIAYAAGITLFKWREAEHEGDYGATTLVAALLTFALGVYAVVGDMTAAAAAGVAMAALLAAKRWLHAVDRGAYLGGVAGDADPAGDELRRIAGSAQSRLRSLRGAEPATPCG